jgi:GTPase
MTAGPKDSPDRDLSEAGATSASADTVPQRAKRLPVVAIVGRPNVGKSSLLNALVGKRISIVQDMPGVTRDRISTPLKIPTANGDRYVELIDTGGYGFVDPDQLTEHIRHQIELAMTQADLVLFLADAQAGLTSADEQIASLLRRQGVKTIPIANKADSPKADVMLGDFARLGLGTPIGVSAMNDRNIDQVYRVIEQNLDLSDAPAEVPPPEMLVAIVGKRNAGKSTLVNAIAELFDPRGSEGGAGDRVIVSEVPGTTRDSIDVRFEKEGKSLVVIDTAGVRKKRHMVTNDVEFYSFHRAQRSIRRADVVLMLIDGTERVSEPDKKLAQYIAEQHKPVVLVVNKWDLVLENAQQQAEERKAGFSSDLLMEEFREYISQELRHLDYAPIAFVTAKDGRRVQAVVDMAQHLFNQAGQRVTTHKLNEAVAQIMQERQPSTRFGRRVKVFYVTQTDVAPPTIVVFVNNAEYVNETYQRFMINRMRELLPFAEVPIKLVVRTRARQAPGGGAREGGGHPAPAKRPHGSAAAAAGRGKKAARPGKPPRAKHKPGKPRAR